MHQNGTGQQGTDTPQASSPIEAAERQKAIVVRIVRAVFIVLLVTVTLLVILKTDDNATGSALTLALGWPITLVLSVLLGVGVVSVDVLTPVKKISTLSGVAVGLLIAMLSAVAISFVIDLLAQTYLDTQTLQTNRGLISSLKVIIGICLSYLAISTVIQTQDDFRLVIPYVEFAKQVRGLRPLLLDSSALIDARIEALCKTGAVQSPVVIPTFVVNELQTLADSGDEMKRQKGRRGLDVIGRLQKSAKLDVTIDETHVPGKAVDQMLVQLASLMGAVIATTDSGLARVASIRGVETLNLNEIAAAMRSTIAPGERLELRIIKRGGQPGQGVGYLEDGTMIVVEHAAEMVNTTAEVEVTGSTHTAAGRMFFAAPVGYEPDAQTEPVEPTEDHTEEPEPAAVAPREPNLPDRPGRSRSPRNPRRG